ncbi:MAG: TPM domain-containing protein [Flammeovirgaceae bacterium]|nr:TPM domain-containing protein [Flammeovirgaceae bacterium]
MFLVAMQDRLMRIEVGYGLEGVLTDALSSRINRNEVAPFF